MTHTSPVSPPPVHWSKAAIASAILAVMGFSTLWMLVGLFLAAAGAVCGHVARYDTSQEPLRGRRLATFGVAVGYLGMLTFPIILILVSLSFPAFSRFQTEMNENQREKSEAKGAELYQACEAYARDNRGRYPAQWENLSGRYLSERELRETLRSSYEGGRAVSFEIVPHDRPVLNAIADSVIVIQEIAPRNAKNIAVVYANGSVRTIHNPDYQSQ